MIDGSGAASDPPRDDEPCPPCAKAGPRDRLVARALLLGGGALALWGTLVCVALVGVLVAGDPGPGGPTQLVLGGLVIGVSPVLFGAFVGWLGLRRLRAFGRRRLAPGREAEPDDR